MEAGSVSRRLQEITRDMAKALDMLPLGLLAVSKEVVDHMQLVRIHVRSIPERDEEESNLVRELEEAVARLERKDEGAPPDVKRLRDLFLCLGLDSLSKCRDEIKKLQYQILLQAGTDAAPYAVDRIRSLIGLVIHVKSIVFKREEKEVEDDDFELVPCSPSFRAAAVSGWGSATSRLVGKDKDDSYWNVPEELKCPISLDLMRDPVIVESGHTYDCASISEWLDSGHSTCRLSGQKLPRQPPLISNYAIRSLVSQWCDRHNVPFHLNNAAGVGDDAIKVTAAFLVGKLATGSQQVQTQAAYELRLLAKRRTEIRQCIAEAGAIPFLVPLLSSTSDSRAQENAVTALLNLSINDNNKSLIMATSGAVDAIVEVVQNGGTMAARENAAALIFSLSVVADYKVTIGAKPSAIPALVALLREGNCRGKKNAATALYNLSVYKSNKDAVLKAGVLGMLLNIVVERRDEEKESATAIDDALALLSLLAGCAEGLEEILSSEKPVIPSLINLISVASDRGKENAIAVLTAMCHSGGEAMVGRLAESIIPFLQMVASTGSSRLKRKAASLLKILTARPTQYPTANG
ncbi:U-box domain-containing protein 1-like [Cryptomeria japonica]|uniref:U-box domain-containing protein 1-like n=1 Tax=Cryptomeria japonica TaxID=3369 RepID=UPI0027DA5E48|nr:U-box domain-containing protein 1-like [Cryptomeria japonica]